MNGMDQECSDTGARETARDTTSIFLDGRDECDAPQVKTLEMSLGNHRNVMTTRKSLWSMFSFLVVLLICEPVYSFTSSSIPMCLINKKCITSSSLSSSCLHSSNTNNGQRQFDLSSIYIQHQLQISPIQKGEDGTDSAYTSPPPRNTYEYNLQIHQLAKSGQAEEAELLLRELEFQYYKEFNANMRPDTITYNSVIHAYARSGGDAHVAEAVLDRMLSLYKRYHDKVVVFPGYEDEDEEGHVESEGYCPYYWNPAKPNVRTYSSVVDAWAKSGHAEAAIRAENILDIMEKTEDEDTWPNTVTYNTVISAWASSDDPDAASHAHRILTQMLDNPYEGAEADIISYNSVLNAWAKHYPPQHGAEQAEKLLLQLEEQQSDGIQPNVMSYTTVMDAWSRFGNPLRVQFLLQKMESASSPHIKPNVYGYTIAISAWARSREIGKARQVLSLLRGMQMSEEDHVKPTLVSYNSVLNACATTYEGGVEEKVEAWDIAQIVFQELEKLSSPSMAPDHITYGTILKACANLLPYKDNTSERRKCLVEKIFRKCCKDGQVSSGVLFQLRQAAPSDLYRALLGKYIDSAENKKYDSDHEYHYREHDKDVIHRLDVLPKEWRRNVREKKSRKTRPNRNRIL